jgi:stringent starvation protein B
MKPLKPYLIPAYYAWIEESGYTPYLLVQADVAHVVVPPQYIDKDDESIVLNISAMAVNNFVMDDYSVRFQARFDGVVWDVCVPYYAILGLYAQENEAGIMFDLIESEVEQGEKAFVENQKKLNGGKKPVGSHPHLRVVKKDES